MHFILETASEAEPNTSTNINKWFNPVEKTKIRF